MKKQTADSLENISNVPKSIQITINSVKSILNVEKTMEVLKSLSNIPKSFLEKSIEHLPNVETRFACGGGAAV